MEKLKEKWKKPDGAINYHKRKRHADALNGWEVSDNVSGPSKRMRHMRDWLESDDSDKPPAKSSTPRLSQSLCRQGVLTSFHDHFAKKSKFKSDNVRLYKRPFQVATIDNFLENAGIVKSLVREMEQMQWTRKQMDLYEFYQTTDLANVNLPCLTRFYEFLKNEVRCYLQHVTGMKFARVSASCSMYNFGDHLLTHDDLLSDRLIAFIFYLSPWKGKDEWDETMGGALELFTIDEDGQPVFPAAKRIFPTNNKFSFFRVEKKSFHQVAEVLTKAYPRLTINGWFHGFEDNPDFDADAVKVKQPNVPIFKSPNAPNSDLDLALYVKKFYLKQSNKKSIQQLIEENSETSLGEFLRPEFFNRVEDELSNEKLKWILKGPTNQQCYEILDVENVRKKTAIRQLVQLFTSSEMMKLLHEYTELDLYGSNAKKPKVSIEIQRWKGGCYTLLGDASTYNNDSLDLFLYFGGNENVGVVNYLTPEDANETDKSSDEDDESTLLTIYPQNNYLNIVYRSQGTTKFTKYVSKLTCMSTEFNYIVSCSYKE